MADNTTPNASDLLNSISKSISPPQPPKQRTSYPPKPKNSNTLIGRFLEHSANIGFQRSNRFIVLIKGPSIKTNFSKDASNRNTYINFGNGASRMPLIAEHQSRLALACQEASFAGKALTTEEFAPIGNAPNTIHAYGELYTGDLSLTFLNSSDFFERMYFQNWLDKIVNPGTHEVALYDDYAKPWSIIVACLPDYRQGANNVTSDPNSGTTLEDVENAAVLSKQASQIYFLRYDHVYPYRIQEQTVSSGTQNEIMKFQVQFKYHRWYDPVVRYMQQQETIRQGMINLPTAMAANVRDNVRRTLQDRDIAANYTPVQRIDGPYYKHIPDPIDQVGIFEEVESPFERFKRIARDVARYSNPRDLKGLIVNRGLGGLNEVFGEGNVENVAVGGQITDVYLKTDPKNYDTTTSKLIGPLGELL